ncbi:ATP-dependent RNA helicase HrpA [Pelomicrobium methylotrophicum]|uniref:ATP-dependent RNA helicase HrpA n=1 Tax=Pelomicrobium methylotrophicum TaxID=2602750 RepID=A0A5C7EXB8_9PROT|nr:ATP-dependent RNA helicase HrpA [Pelomicrobium methylotrophicum]TXF13053.1 ATP-dependent RNA helicase HrpA [Pelomicrobium methylotrophicum]
MTSAAALRGTAFFERLSARLHETMARDRYALAEALTRVVSCGGDPARLRLIEARLEASAARFRQRLARLPVPTFPEELPISQKREEIAAAIASNPVVIVCGETGSGKTTQLPKICLALQRGVAGMIGHTQPRRIAARTVAARIATELATPLGRAVGFKVRFSDRVSDESYVKLMTDGILLAETQADPLLAAYDTLIIDEAHERSLNIDFLLGYVKQLLPKRPDLKVIITSATIDAERFSRHFGDAPVVEVSGRLYPVEIRYRPFEESEDDGRGLTEAIADAVDEAARLGPGDILVFLPGEREIRDTAEALRKHHPVGTEILPLYARLSAAEQARVFEPSRGRRVVLATNVAETSLTVPGIRYVIDSGYARVKRYSYRQKVEQLLTEKISQASANQRAGRCGRVASGVCFRLYSEEDFAARPPFTDPEILRSSLASVILRMQALNLGEVQAFPFVDPPAPKAIADGYQLLTELGAVDENRRITKLGRELARLPIDPRIGRMILAARDEHCLTEVLIIASALSVQDPRERPMEKTQAADQAHAEFSDERSDFLSYLKIWKFFDEALKHKKSNRKLREEIQARFLSHLRLREWRDIHGQLHALVTEMGMRLNEAPGTYEQIHRALLAGLPGNVGMKSEEPGEYQGARGIKFLIHPASGLRRKAPKWIVAAELTETTRLYARCVAAIEPAWIEQVAGHLVKRSYFEPRWEKGTAQVVAWEQVSLHGLIVVPRRRVHYGPIDPKTSREIFIRQALVAGDFECKGEFFRHNARLRKEIEALEHKSRRQDVLVDEERMFAFFDARVPPDVYNGISFERWRREAEAKNPRLLFMSRDDLMRHEAEGITEALYPESLEVNGVALRLSYRFEPGHPMDGVTVTVPLHLLNQLPAAPFEWLVPGMLREKVNALIRGLPKSLRRVFVPIPECVTEALTALDRHSRRMPLTEALSAVLKETRGVEVPPDAWSTVDLPAHHFMNFRVVDEKGAELAMGRDLNALRRDLGRQAEASFAPESAWERPGLKRWGDLELPEEVEFRRGKHTLKGYPALVDEGDSVRLTLLETPEKALEATRAGINRLFRLELKEQLKDLERSIKDAPQLVMLYAPYGDGEALKEELTAAIVERAVWSDESPIRTRRDYEARAKQVRAKLQVVCQEYVRLLTQILTEAQAVKKLLATPVARAWRHVVPDMGRQLDALVHRGFLTRTPYARLVEYPRYLKAMQRRLEKLQNWGERDAKWTAEIERLTREWQRRVERSRNSGAADPKLEEFRWMLEELRVSLFAQELRTPYPVSVKRLDKVLAELR